MIAVYPPANSIDNFGNSLIYLTFSADMKQTETQNALTITGMTGQKTWWNRILIFRPDSLYTPGDTIRITLSTAAQSTAGTALATVYTSSFICGASADSIRPTVSSTNPASGQIGVSVTASISAAFSEKLAPWSVSAFSMTGVTSILGNTALQSDSIINFSPSSLLCYGMTFTAIIDTSVTDLCGNHLSPQHSWTFQTMADTVKPKVLSLDPANNDTLVSVNKSIIVRFSEVMDTASARAAFSITPAATGNFSWTGDSIMTFALAETLAFRRQFQVTVGTGAQDLAGNPLAATWNSSFTTVRGIYVCCNTSNDIYMLQQNDLKFEGYLPGYIGAKQVKMSSDGNRAYVLCGGNPGQLYFLEVKNDNNNLGNISVGNTPYGLAVSTDGSKLAVSVSGDNRVLIINADTRQIIDTIATGNTPTGIVFSADGAYIYVILNQDTRVERYNLSTHALDWVTIIIGGEEAVLSPNGSRLFVTNGSYVTVITTSTFSAPYNIQSVSARPFGLAVSPDGAHLAVGCYTEGLVKVYSATSGTEPAPLAQITVGTGPNGLAYSPDGRYLYASNSGSSSISVISRSGNTYTAQTPKTVGSGPWGIAVTP
ncbi:MAG: Ig-like domain-containing protein [Candidatus Edwardsbacteria bacterium]|nr:Ig-like domain-containing protein [Candidatus Edwardsbacteria bacterium]MBU1575877.1 Ig-like domain-containing protein [Candidatus Edwardsbacteria bacterium]MBU2464351.1 Ig-like domain-containing protein [Candidatus Edwardsbacteria bacterium]MBU2593091.1 Ig-like domain-containing protein [Candidatus Edwardsbacteria bacterium]